MQKLCRPSDAFGDPDKLRPHSGRAEVRAGPVINSTLGKECLWCPPTKWCKFGTPPLHQPFATLQKMFKTLFCHSSQQTLHSKNSGPWCLALAPPPELSLVSWAATRLAHPQGHPWSRYTSIKVQRKEIVRCSMCTLDICAYNLSWTEHFTFTSPNVSCSLFNISMQYNLKPQYKEFTQYVAHNPFEK